MLSILTIAVMLIVAYAMAREGFFSAVCMLFNIVIAGLIAFTIFEPAASAIEVSLQKSILESFEDYLILMIVFSFCLGMLRMVTNNLNNLEVTLEPVVNQVGGGVVGLITGYILAGFLICTMETLPWSQNFLGFEPFNEAEPAIRRVFPPDRVWLAMMHRAGDTSLARGEAVPTFDADGAFESNYFRFRRYLEGPPEKN